MKIQIIGLPGSGKTTVIKEFIKSNPKIKHLDIRNHPSRPGKNNKFAKEILKSSGPLIAESACGVNIRGAEVVRLQIPDEICYKRVVERDGQLDEDYMSLLRYSMIPAKYTVRSQEALMQLLDNIFNG